MSVCSTPRSTLGEGLSRIHIRLASRFQALQSTMQQESGTVMKLVTAVLQNLLNLRSGK